MRKGQKGPGVPGGHGNTRSRHRLGPGNTNQWPRQVGTRYSPPGTTQLHHPGYYPATAHRCTARTSPRHGTRGHRTYDSLESTKEILGVEYALYTGGSRYWRLTLLEAHATGG